MKTMEQAIAEGNCGEYLGDFEVTHEMLSNLENVNRFTNRIHGVPRGKYMMTAYFDLNDGHFIGLQLTPDEEDEGNGSASPESGGNAVVDAA
jgi:hypothetical protein